MSGDHLGSLQVALGSGIEAESKPNSASNFLWGTLPTSFPFSPSGVFCALRNGASLYLEPPVPTELQAHSHHSHGPGAPHLLILSDVCPQWPLGFVGAGLAQ